MKLKLYHLSRGKVEYEEYSECVVCAPSEEQARLIHPNGGVYPHQDWNLRRIGAWSGNDWAEDPSLVKVRLIGDAIGCTDGEVIVSV